MGEGEGGGDAASKAGPEPTSFCDGRYEVKRFLGEGGKKRVYLAHDSLLDRDVAFALIRLQLAELLMDEELATGIPLEQREQERAEALGRLEFAIEEFSAMKMQPALERALRHKGLLHA